jgi:hypothetical protein
LNIVSLTVITEGGEHWTVSPHLLRKTVEVKPASRNTDQSLLTLDQA